MWEIGKTYLLIEILVYCFGACLVSQIGDGIHYFVLTWLVLDLTGSGAALGTVLFASSLPAVILTLSLVFWRICGIVKELLF